MNTFGEIIEKIVAADKIIIHRHVHPDPDALGSQLGLAESIHNTYPEKKVLITGGPVGDLDWVSTMDEVSDADYKDALVIVVDTANTPRISDQRYDKGNFLIKIDHHPDVDDYGDMKYVNTSSSSCSEILVDMIDSAGQYLKLDDKAAKAFYTGIVGDTGRFMYPSTTVHTFDVAAQLVSYNFKPNEVCQQMGQLSLNQARLQGYVFENLKIDKSGAAMVIIPTAELKKLGLKADDASVVVSTPGRLAEVHSWVIAVENDDNSSYRIHLRSQGPVINGIAAMHDGGGHPLASGAKAKDKAEVKQIFKDVIGAQEEIN